MSTFYDESKNSLNTFTVFILLIEIIIKNDILLNKIHMFLCLNIIFKLISYKSSIDLS